MLCPYVSYDGNCEAAFKFYEKALGAKIEMLLRNEEAPPEMPVGSVQQPQHDVSGFGAAILNAAWNSRVTVGAR